MSDSPSTSPANSQSAPDNGAQTRPWHPWALLLAGGLLYLPFLGAYGPLDPTDSFFIEAGREAVETSQYLLPMINYEPWLDKPILYFWAVAGSFKLLGINAFAGRIFTALTAIALGLVTYSAARPFLGARQAFLAALAFYASPLSSALGHVSLTDMPLTLFMSAGLFGLFHHLQKGGTLPLILGYLGLALAFLVKGPIAVILVGAILVLHIGFTSSSLGEIFKTIWRLNPLLGLAIITAVNLPWYYAANQGTNGKFFQAFFITQNFGRMTGTVNHQQPFYFYIPVFCGGLFPFNLFLLAAPILNKRYLKQRLKLSPSQSFILLQVIWSVFVLALFSAIKTKLPTYILPAMAPLAILFAHATAVVLRRGKARALWLPAVIITAATIGGLIASYKVTGWAGLLLQQAQPLLYTLVATSAAILFFIFRGKLKAAVITIYALALVSVAVAVPMAHIAFFEDRQKPVDALTAIVVKEGGTLGTIIRQEPSFSYFTHKHVPYINSPEEAQKFITQTSAPHWILAPIEVLQNIDWFYDKPGGEAPPEIRGKTRKWTLFKLAGGR